MNELPSARPISKPSASAAPSIDPLEAEGMEVALLDRAQSAVAAHPEEALAICEEHARRFSRGVLVQEREVLAIDALLRAGRRVEAETRAARFRSAFPSSGHLRRIDVLLSRTSAKQIEGGE